MTQIGQRWRPDNFSDFHERLKREPAQAARALDTALHRSFQGLANLENQIASTQFGVATVTGSALQFATGLSVVNHAVATIDNGATATNFWVTVTPSAKPGAIDIRVWKPTANNDNTPIAATTAVKVRWSATGTA